MKKIIYIFLMGSFLLASCTDLEVENKAALPQDVVLADVEGFEAVLFAAYESVNDFGYYGQTMMIAPEILADNMELAQLTGRYELEYVNALNSGIDIWFNRYTAINECNIVINLINGEGVAGDQATKDQIVAEAKFLRALFYHDLARVYGYEPGQEVDGFNASVILRTEPTLGLSNADDRARATNVQVYEQIEQDLLEAIPALPDATAGAGAVARANKSAARLLLARVYLYWGRNSDAATLAQQVIEGDGSDLVPAADYLASWDDAANPFHPESVFESDLQAADWSTVDGANASLHSLLMNDEGGSQFIIVASDELIATIESQAGDVRRGLFNTEALGEEFAKWQGNKGTASFQENIPILRLSEGYLIAAEALGAGAGDPFLNALRVSRGLAGGVSATVDNVLRERRIEYMAEGHRWFDLKRLGRNIPKPAVSGASTLPYNDFKILPRLPQAELELSDGALVQNPFYN
ncbi:RagB/SusD family nutrient uptake outer membrane protein [Marivirga sp. S37H4]|uniref:RagB/SusD family nutrient uptake outer membrane protein n=1 Tax=Marivirga aurantiaca TaxID=2802615 RepID=A0A934WY94_9BACT|nr:RagB/SusD family nutrient uptake outer membrane protein [Marivirga aurantiaca]MBK6265010.1 RagB/SusD family nutrient uptake outer membrane protein [Marivirga aurantiaca]